MKYIFDHDCDVVQRSEKLDTVAKQENAQETLTSISPSTAPSPIWLFGHWQVSASKRSSLTNAQRLAHRSLDDEKFKHRGLIGNG